MTRRINRKIAAIFAAGDLVADGVTGGVIAATDVGDDNEAPITGAAYQQAVDAALAFTGGGSVTETEAGDEDGAYEVEVRLPDGRSVDVRLDENFVPIDSQPDNGGDDD